ncbi:C3HC4 zinc finger domain-containing protein [Histoplasma capsulatum var. duboisii H88]|uniref:C3HC4 zinc finger domain-containing protein n=1 Tax=Ajellomyces capsulatus (strain H88) TaxID=544711 RepID=A0A8A1LRA4_AJEC8|nr:C3HC4 zinc finger domain-containing protein [Histoplasma capsulatum var. duboisii H88]
MSNCPLQTLILKCIHKNATGCQLPCSHSCCFCVRSHPCAVPDTSRDSLSRESPPHPRYCSNCKEYWASQINRPSSASPKPVSGSCVQQPQPHSHCALPLSLHWTASPYNYPQSQNRQLSRDICVPDYPGNGQRQSAVITEPSQRFTNQPSLQRNQGHPNQDEFHQQVSWIPRHAASNSYTFGQAASNPLISHHRAYMPVNHTGMAGRHEYASPGTTIPTNLQASIASEPPPYTFFSNQQSQGQTHDQPGPNSFWEPGINHFLGTNLQAQSRETNLNYGYFPTEHQQIYYSTSPPTEPVTRPFATVESRQQGNPEQNGEARADIQNQGPFNQTSLNHAEPFMVSDSNLPQPEGQRLFSRLSGSSTMTNSDNPLHSFTFQNLPVDSHNTQFNNRGSVDNEALNGSHTPRNTTFPYTTGSPPIESQADLFNHNSRRSLFLGAVSTSGSPPGNGSLNANITAAGRRRPRRTNESGMSQSGPMLRGDQRQLHRHTHHSASGINIGVPGVAPATRDQGYVNAHLARLLYAGNLVRYPNDPDSFFFGTEAGRRRRFLESLNNNNSEPTTPTKGLDNQDDGRPEPKETEDLTVNLECKACMSQLIDTVVLPCGHAVLCRWCADQHMPSSRVDKTKPRGSATCPMCRKPVKQKIRIYLS